MVLSQSILEGEFAKMMDPDDPGFIGHPATAALAAANFANAYDLYALDAVDESGDAVVTVSKSGFESALALANTGTAITAAAEFGAAFVAYWTGGVFAVGIVPLGVNCPNVGGNGMFASEVTSSVLSVSSVALVAALTTEFGILSMDGAAKAAAFAALFHTATTADVLVLITGLDTTPAGGGGPLPITNTCQIM